MFRSLCLCSAAAIAAALGSTAPAAALSMKECGAKYQEARKNDTLKGMKWNDFRKAECADEDASDADAAAAEKADATPASTGEKAETGSSAKPSPTPAPKSATAPTGGKAAFPTEVSSQYAGETPGKARMKTCLDQYRANKAANAEQPNWIAKGGGYYSQCNTKLKEKDGA